MHKCAVYNKTGRYKGGIDRKIEEKPNKDSTMGNYQSSSMPENNSFIIEHVCPTKCHCERSEAISIVENKEIATSLRSSRRRGTGLSTSPWMQVSDDSSVGHELRVPDSFGKRCQAGRPPDLRTCPDCHASMVRLGRCLSCPSCGWSSCAV